MNLNSTTCMHRCNPVALSYAIITKDEFTLFVQEKEITDSVKAYCDKEGIILKDYHSLIDEVDKASMPGNVLFDKRNTNFLTYKALLQKASQDGVKLVNKKDPTELMKAVKNETEISDTTKAHIKDGVALTHFIYWVKNAAKSGKISEVDAAEKLRSFR